MSTCLLYLSDIMDRVESTRYAGAYVYYIDDKMHIFLYHGIIKTSILFLFQHIMYSKIFESSFAPNSSVKTHVEVLQ